MFSRLLGVALTLTLLLGSSYRAEAGAQRTFAAGSLVIPMDLAYQDHGMLQAYGLVFQLLRQGVTVHWVIDPDKTWHAAACDTAGDECAWDCAEEGSGLKCPYPTASPDFYGAAKVLWDDSAVLAPDTAITRHGYRGGPFLIDAADKARVLPIIEAWNDQDRWAANSWAQRSVFQVVSVHELRAEVSAYVRKTMVAAPSIAVFSDGNEDIATSYLRAAGIPQSNGQEFPPDKCNDACGPGTDNPDMLTVESIMGEMGTCDAPNLDHKNGALFTPDGVPAFCQIMSMHWGVKDRETVKCDDGDCPATQAECSGERFTYHGHEVVAEVRKFLEYPTHFFAECQAVNAYENTVPNPAWPYLDDSEREGHFLTTTGIIPDCPCTVDGFECVTGGCDDGARDCCLPKEEKELGAGFLIAEQPDSKGLKIFHPFVPYNQMDGFFQTTGGSEPAYNLSDYLQTKYKNDQEITFISGPDGPGVQDIWMTGYMEGDCWIGSDDVSTGTQCTRGKVSYLGGHDYTTGVPLSQNHETQGTRLFLNALFEADCVTSVGQPSVALWIDGREALGANTLPATSRYQLHYSNSGAGAALAAELEVVLPAETDTLEYEASGALAGSSLEWGLGSISGQPARAGDPPSSGSRWLDLRFAQHGDHTLQVILRYRVGASVMETTAEVTVHVGPDADNDGVPDGSDPAPNDADRCGDSDMDTCDDCAMSGAFDPQNDGPDADGDGICDAGEGRADAGVSGDGVVPGIPSDDGCSCRSGGAAQSGLGSSLLLLVALLWRRRRG